MGAWQLEHGEIVFPARAGMNRSATDLYQRVCVPRAGGRQTGPVFPARAGMNRRSGGCADVVDVFPARAGMNRSDPARSLG